MKRLHQLWLVVQEATIRFYEGNMLNYSASIAFFTIFSFPGIFILVVLIASVFFSEEAVRHQLYDQVRSVVGPESAREIQQVMVNISNMEHTLFATVVGIGTILFGATSVFISIQDGLNIAWGLRHKPRRFALKFILNRMLSFAIVLGIGFIMLVSLLVDALLVLFQDFWVLHLPGDALRFIEGFNKASSAAIITLIFLLVYRFLPNGKIAMKFLIPGSLMSMTFFVLGKYLIGIYLGNSSPGTAYGAAGSLVVLLIWVFYSSIVLLFGAQFIHALSNSFGGAVNPDSDTVKIVTHEVSAD